MNANEDQGRDEAVIFISQFSALDSSRNLFVYSFSPPARPTDFLLRTYFPTLVAGLQSPFVAHRLAFPLNFPFATTLAVLHNLPARFDQRHDCQGGSNLTQRCVARTQNGKGRKSPITKYVPSPRSSLSEYCAGAMGSFCAKLGRVGFEFG